MSAECLESPGLLLLHLRAWKLVLPSAQGMERPPGAGLPRPNASEGSLGFPFAQFEGKAKSRLVLSNPSSRCEGNLPACLQLPQGSPATWRLVSVREDGCRDLREGIFPASCSFVSSPWKEH